MFQTQWDISYKTVKQINERDVIDALMQLSNHQIPPLQQFISIITSATEILSAKQNCVYLDLSPSTIITIVGDTHGCFQSIMQLFEGPKNDILRLPNAGHCYIFNGDYCDRGGSAYQILFYLTLLLINCPDNSIVVNRGNHESSDIALSPDWLEQNMYKELVQKFPRDNQLVSQAVRALTNFFGSMSIAALVNRRVFVTHGGTPEDRNIRIEQVLSDQISRTSPTVDMDSPVGWKQMLWNYSREEFDCMFMSFNNLKTMVLSHTASPYHNIHVFNDDNGRIQLSRRVVNEHQFSKSQKLQPHQRAIVEIFSSPTNQGMVYALSFQIKEGYEDPFTWLYICLGSSATLFRR